MSSRIWILGLTAVAACKCPPDRSTTDRTRTLEGPGPACFIDDSPESPKSGTCSAAWCGNSAQIYGDQIEALDEYGKGTQKFDKPFRLVRGSLQNAGGACAGVADLSIGVRDGGFVGVVGPGGESDRVVCSGADLVKARFQVEQKVPGKASRSATVRIDGMGEVEVWRRHPDDPDEPPTVPTYALVTEASSELAIEEPLCKEARWDSTLVNPPFGNDKTRNALLLVGETYSKAGTKAHAGKNWFNIGCAGTAIAKLRLLGFDPAREPDATDHREATLKMITAKYCGERSWTRDGTLIGIDPHPGGPLPPGGPTLGPVEARWSATGATCISHSRMWFTGSKCEKESEQRFIEQIRSTCHIPACEETAACGTNAPVEDGFWRTCTVNHTKVEN